MWNAALLVWMIAVAAAVFALVPPAEGLGYLVRIIFFHIPMAWVAVLCFLLSAWWAFTYLRSNEVLFFYKSSIPPKLGLVFCLLATLSGAVFAKLTWGSYWNWDPRQTTIFILLLLYGAYVTLDISARDTERQAKLCSVYALMAFVTVPFLVFIIPRFYYSLHPEPLLNQTGSLDMDNTMLLVLLAALLGCSWLFMRLLRYFLNRRNRYIT